MLVMLALRSILFALLLPGTVTVAVPYLIVHQTQAAQFEHWTLWRWLGLLPISVGVAMVVWCIWDFTVFGRGTLAPVDPPRQLVVRGPYRCVRNPMYVGVVSILLGEALLFQSFPLVVYTIFFFVAAHCFVVLYEEPVLRRKFGESYAAYCHRVHRWWPHAPHGSAV
jgi:protein-S-isoprenylcysteine O-methyltransferase Ste14